MEKHFNSNLPEPLYTAMASRQIDQSFIESGQASAYDLMFRAGQFVFEHIIAAYPKAANLSVLCGSGNNGGDGYIVAALVHQFGLNLKLIAFAPPATATAKQAAEFAIDCGVSITDLNADFDLSQAFQNADVLVDALLGTGVDRQVTGSLKRLIDSINESSIKVVSCDVPSGLNSDTGKAMGAAIKADFTVVFMALKIGLFTAEGKHHAGSVLFTDLGVDADQFTTIAPVAKLISNQYLKQIYRVRHENAHKGSNGYVAIAGGAPGMLGAALMAAKAAYRSGAGRVKALTQSSHAVQLALACPELMTLADDDWQASEFNVIALGPGLGLSQWSRQLYQRVLQSTLPLVVDADALNLLASEPFRRENWVLTPHPGEAARLLACTVSDIQNDRVAAANKIVETYGGICVLKGSGTLIASERQGLRVCRQGNAGQATAGMGDVLTGCIAALIGQGYGLFEAACFGVWLHASSADEIAQSQGKVGMLASDVIAQIPFKYQSVYG